jgi:hypothetical protein
MMSVKDKYDTKITNCCSENCRVSRVSSKYNISRRQELNKETATQANLMGRRGGQGVKKISLLLPHFLNCS